MLNSNINGYIPKYEFDQNIHLFNLGDVHFGSIATHKEFFQHVIKKISTDPATYWVSTGDILDVNLAKSKFFDHAGMEANEEFNVIVDLLRPIAGKCLGFVGSNHSERVHRFAGLNFDQILAKTMDIPYLGGLGLINITLSCPKTSPIKRTYYVAMHHGSSNAITLGSKANSLQRLSDVFSNVDLVLEGHTHTFMVSTKEVQVIDRDKNKLRSSTVTMCTCAHCLDWSKSYAADNKYTSTPAGFPVFHMSNTHKKVDVQLIIP